MNLRLTSKVACICIALLITFQFSYATVRTTSNDIRGGSQYNTLQAAFDNSMNGDTILLEGTDQPYNILDSWNKSLVVIGTGYNPQKQNPKTSKISASPNFGIFMLDSNGNGSRFYGIEFATGINSNGSLSINNYQFMNCKFQSILNMNNGCQNLVYKNCIFLFAIDFSYSVNTFFTSCVFNQYLYGPNSLGLTVDHCLFLATTGTTALYSLHSVIIANSIFMNSDIFYDVNYSTFSNNIFHTATAIPSGIANGGGGNIFNANPNFINYTLDNGYSPLQDYHVSVSSPAHNAALDGTDIGLHGGFSKFNESGEPLIAPVMRVMNVMQAITTPSSTIQVQVQASKPNDN